MPRYLTREAAALQSQLWTPRELQGGLQLWVDSGDPSTISASSSVVTAAADRGLRSTSMAWATAGQQAGLVGTAAVPLSLPIVVCLVAQLNTTTTQYCRGLSFVASGGFDYAGGANLIITMNDISTTELGTFHNGVFYGKDTYTPNTPFIYTTQILSGGAVSHYLNGATGSTGTTFWTGGTGKFIIACVNDAGSQSSPVNDNWQGPWGSVVVAGGNEAVAMRRKIEGWSAWQWGLQNTLPGSHPYRNAPPLVGA